MIIGRFIKYKGYEGSIEYDKEDKILHGSLYDIKDSVSYHGYTIEELFDSYKRMIDEYKKIKKEKK